MNIWSTPTSEIAAAVRKLGHGATLYVHDFGDDGYDFVRKLDEITVIDYRAGMNVIGVVDIDSVETLIEELKTYT